MAEDVPENHVVSEDVAMLTGVTELEQWQPPVARHPIHLNKDLLGKEHSTVVSSSLLSKTEAALPSPILRRMGEK